MAITMALFSHSFSFSLQFMSNFSSASRFSSIFMLLLLLLLTGQFLQPLALNVGINYGQKANNLPSPTTVVTLLQSISISRVKLYDANSNILTAFSNSNVEFIVGIGNVLDVTDSSNALSWIQQNVQPFLPQTKISCVTVGNEVLTSNDTNLMNNLLPAMQSVHQALVSLGLDQQVAVASAHSLDILSNSFPPSSGSFRQDLVQYIQPILNFHSQTNSPFLINAYPFFAYKANPTTVSLEYVLFEPNQGVVDPATNLNYDNMLYAQLDSVRYAVKALGISNVDVKISETGWPSSGDSDEPGATPQNAATYNGNLMQRIATGQGTPMSPSTPVDVYVFALFNENMKPGPTSERNYGLFYPDATPVYNFKLQEDTSSTTFSSSDILVMSYLNFLTLAVAAMAFVY